MGKPHWFPFYVNDFLSSSKVTLMSNEERGGYLLLLCHEWNDPRCTLPDDDEAIRKLSQLMGDLTLVKSCFLRKRGRLVNERLYTEWIKTKEKSDLAKMSVAIRWKNERNTNVLPTQYSSQSQSELHSEKKEEKKKMPQRAIASVDSEWIAELGKNPAYKHINFTMELGKMEAWLELPKNKHRKKTRSFVLNWLNKIEPTMTSNGKATPPPFPPCTDPIARNQWRQAYGDPKQYGYQ